MGTLSNKYFNAEAVETALDKGVEAYDSTIEIKEDLSELDAKLSESIVEISNEKNAMIDAIASSKNLIDTTKLTVGSLTNDVGGIYETDSLRTTDYIRVSKGVSITFSPYIRRFLSFDLFKNSIKTTYADVNTQSPYTFTPSQDGYIRASFLTTLLGSIQAEYGTVATEYKKYQLALNDVDFGSKQYEFIQNKIVENLKSDNEFPIHEMFIGNNITQNTGYANSTLEYVYTNKHPYALKVLNNKGNGLTTVLECPFRNIINVNGMSYATMKLFVKNANKLTSIRVIYRTSTNAFAFDKTYTDFVEGYNEIRIISADGMVSANWGEISNIRMFIVSSTGSEIDFYSIEGYYPKTAKLIFIDDVGYKETKENLSNRLSVLNIPTAWACQYGGLGSVQSGRGTRLSESDIIAMSKDSMSEFTFHTFNGGVSSSMTEKQNADDTLKSIRYMEEHNLKPNKVYRGAWFSNLCTNHKISDTMLEASATYSGGSGLTVFPFVDKYNFPRIGLHGTGMTNAKYDELFDKLKKTHCTMICYTHSVAPSITEDVTVDEQYSMSALQADYFVSKCSTGVSEGWLEGTTISRLLTFGEETI